MANEEIIPIVYKWRKWEDYINPTAFLYYQNGKISFDQLNAYMKSSGYKDYLKEEIAERNKRHKPVLELFKIGETLNDNSKTAVDYFFDGQFVCTCETPSELTRGTVAHDNYPFSRDFLLPDGRKIEIRDKQSNSKSMYEKEESRANSFTTEVTIFRKKRLIGGTISYTSGEVDSESIDCLVSIENANSDGKLDDSTPEKDFFLSYTVSSYNTPQSIIIEYNDAGLYMSDCILEVSYTDHKRKRTLSFVKASKTGDTFQQAEYTEETGIDSSVDGVVKIDMDEFTKEHSFIAGYDRYECPRLHICAADASYYSHAIATHEKSKELINFVLELIYSKVPEIKHFLLEKFPNMINTIEEEKLSIPEIDEVFRIISNPLLSLGKNGFEHADSPELEELQDHFDYLRDNRKRLKWEEKNKDKIEAKERKKALKNAYKEQQQKDSRE